MNKYILVFLIVFGSFSIVGAQEAPEHRVGRFYLGADAGWGYRLGKIEADNIYQKDYMKGLRSGLSIGADASFYIKPALGFGLKYSFFYAANSFGEIWDKTWSNFIAPVYCGRTKSLGAQRNFQLGYSAGIGYLHYRDKGQGLLGGNTVQGIITAETFGMYGDFGAEIRLAPKLYLTGKVYLLASNYYSYTLKTNFGSEKTKLDKPENVSRFGITAGLKINL